MGMVSPIKLSGNAVQQGEDIICKIMRDGRWCINQHALHIPLEGDPSIIYRTVSMQSNDFRKFEVSYLKSYQCFAFVILIWCHSSSLASND